MFSKEKTFQAKPFINNEEVVSEIAGLNQIHRSIIYAFHAHDVGKLNRRAWGAVRKYNPKSEMQILLNKLQNSWNEVKPIDEHIKFIKNQIYC